MVSDWHKIDDEAAEEFKRTALKSAKFNKIRYERAVDFLSSMPFNELVRMLEKKQLPALEMAIGSVLVHAVQKGDIVRLEALTNRMIGPVPKKIDLDMKSIADLFREETAEDNEADDEPASDT